MKQLNHISSFASWLLVTLLLGLLYCRTIQAKPCIGLIDAIVRMSRGVDLIDLDMYPSEMLLNNGFRHSLFDFTCDENRTWVHPAVQDAPQWSVPDQITSINSVPGGSINQKTKFHRTLSEFKKNLAYQAGINLDIWLGSFSVSGSYKEAREQILKKNQSMAEVCEGEFAI